MYKLNITVLTNQAERHLCNLSTLCIPNTTQSREKNNNNIVSDRTPSNVSSFKLIIVYLKKKLICVQWVQPNLDALLLWLFPNKGC